jgi:hypothetical protein
MSFEQQPSPGMSPHVLATYNALNDQIKFMKQQQWATTNYAVLLIAAIAAFSLKGIDESHLHSKLKCFAIVTATGASFLLVKIQWDMMRSRMGLDKLQATYFTNRELVEIGLTEKQQDRLGMETCENETVNFCRGWEFLVALIGVLWGGVILAWWAL